jgi:hypothetical protein
MKISSCKIYCYKIGNEKEKNNNLQMFSEFNKKIMNLMQWFFACREPYLMKVAYMLGFHPFSRFALNYDEAGEDLF